MVNPLGMARWAESPCPAREHNEPLLGAVGTPDAGEDAQAKLPGEGDGAVPTRIVDEDDVVHPLARDVVQRPLQRLLGVVGGYDDDDLLRAFHDLLAADSYSTFRVPGERRSAPGRFSRHDAHENPAASSALKTRFAVDLSGPDPGKPALPHAADQAMKKPREQGADLARFIGLVEENR